MTAVLLRLARLVLILLAVTVAIFPFYWMLRTAIAPRDEVHFTGISLFPSTVDLGNFERAWTGADLGPSMVVGGLVSGAILLGQLLTCIPAAYVLAKVPFRGRDAILALVLACLLVPSQVTLIPTFIGMNVVGLGNSLAGLILPFLTSAFGVYLLRQQMVAVPDALIEAARTDGLGHMRTLWSIVVPLSWPGIAAFSVISVFVSWNEYLWPLLIARSPSLITPPLALANFQHADTGYDYGALAAGAVIVTVPVVVLFLLAQRRFVQGMSGTELPG